MLLGYNKSVLKQHPSNTDSNGVCEIGSAAAAFIHDKSSKV